MRSDILGFFLCAATAMLGACTSAKQVDQTLDAGTVATTQTASVDADYPYVLPRELAAHWERRADGDSLESVAAELKPTSVTPTGALITMQDTGLTRGGAVRVQCDQVYLVPGHGADRYVVLGSAQEGARATLMYPHLEAGVGVLLAKQGEFARSLKHVLSDRQLGQIYELGWPSTVDAAGNAAERRFILHRSAEGKWKVLIELPGHSRTAEATDTMTTRITWNRLPGAALPVFCEIRIETAETKPDKTVRRTVLYGELDIKGKAVWAPHRFLLHPGGGEELLKERAKPPQGY